MIGLNGGSLTDPFGRRIDYLRLSVTEKCNFRCIYCVPEEGVGCSGETELTAQEFERIGRVAVGLGFRKFRLTGGEPTLRPDLSEIVARLGSLQPQPLLVLTTNGFFLQERLPGLLKAGLKGVNVSLDSLQAKRFGEITKSHALQRVLAGLENALTAGLEVKLNVVVMRGINDDEIFAFVDLARQGRIDVRFLEFMPLCGTAWRPELHLPLSEIRARIAQRFTLEPLAAPADQPASAFAIRGSKGRIGFISSLTEPFCDSCSRMRVLANGTIRPCLFSDLAFDLRPALKQKSDEPLRAVFAQAVLEKPKGHHWRGDSARAPESYPLIHNIGG